MVDARLHWQDQPTVQENVRQEHGGGDTTLINMFPKLNKTLIIKLIYICAGDAEAHLRLDTEWLHVHR